MRKIIALLLLILFTSFLPNINGDIEPNNEVGQEEIINNGIHYGNVSDYYEEDRDVYKIFIPEGTTLTLQIEINLDTFLSFCNFYFYYENDEYIWYRKSINNWKYNEYTYQHENNDLVTKVLFVIAFGNYEGDYTLSVDFSEEEILDPVSIKPPSNEIEPNDSFETAQILEEKTYSCQIGKQMEIENHDIYQINVPPNSKMKVNFSHLGRNLYRKDTEPEGYANHIGCYTDIDIRIFDDQYHLLSHDNIDMNYYRSNRPSANTTILTINNKNDNYQHYYIKIEGDGIYSLDIVFEENPNEWTSFVQKHLFQIIICTIFLIFILLISIILFKRGKKNRIQKVEIEERKKQCFNINNSIIVEDKK